MSRYTIDRKKKTLKEVYDCYLLEMNRTMEDAFDAEAFESWLYDGLLSGKIKSRDEKIKDKEEYLSDLIKHEEESVTGSILTKKSNEIGARTKAQRKKFRNDFLNTEEFRMLLKQKMEENPIVSKLKDPDFFDKKYEGYLTDMHAKFSLDAKRGCQDVKHAILVEKIKMLSMQRILFENQDAFFMKLNQRLEAYVSENRLFFDISASYTLSKIAKLNDAKSEKSWDAYTYPDQSDFSKNYQLGAQNINFFVHSFYSDPITAFLNVYEEGRGFWPMVLGLFADLNKELSAICELSVSPVRDILDVWYDDIIDFLYDHEKLLSWSSIHVLSLLMQNPYYKDIADNFYLERSDELDRMALKETTDLLAYQELAKKVKALGHEILNAIPDDYILMYPDARKLSRHFVLHIGPTNSGKTYVAMQALRKAGSGIYLAPLRLLAYEQYEALNRDGYICNLVTGEEKLKMEYASFQSSTIEMADLHMPYKAAVIDEAQMIADRDRGGSWTDAILGLCAEEIHVCAAPHARALLEKLIKMCGDTYEVVLHERQTPLILESKGFIFPDHVAKQDALIVFSRKNVHAVASELQTKKIKCSVLYGNLPYDVRQKEAEKFLTGQTEVVVATDAIGMGMNLPIKRIVFLETDKFDGKDRRSLFDEEFRQIAGRAGRRGIYEKGYVNAVRGKKVIKQALSSVSADLTKAVIRFPDSLLDIDAKLSETINRWKGLFTDAMFEKADVEILYSLCKELELKSDDKRLIYSFLMIPFDEGNADVKAMWHELFDLVLSGNELTIKPYLPDIAENRTDSDYLSILEKNYRVCDLLYAFCERFCDGEDIELVMEKKKLISAKMIRILEKQKLVRRKCKRCRRLLSWNTPYTICDHCYYGF